jgi:hypothetical protein
MLGSFTVADLAASFDPANRTFNHTFTEFIDIEGNRRPIQPNQVYHVKIVARRTVSSFEVSFPGYGSHFISGEVHVRPPIMPIPPLRIEEEDFESVTIGWDTQWFEIHDVATDTWHSRVGVRNGALVFGDDIVSTDTIHELVIADFPTAGDVAMLTAGLSTPAAIRSMNVGPNVGYEIYVVPYEDIADVVGDAARYLAFVTQLHNNNTLWRNITNGVEEVTDITRHFEITGLDPNMTYAIFFRPYNVHADGRVSWWPTMIPGTTLDRAPDFDITPTVPVYLWKQGILGCVSVSARFRRTWTMNLRSRK